MNVLALLCVVLVLLSYCVCVLLLCCVTCLSVCRECECVVLALWAGVCQQARGKEWLRSGTYLKSFSEGCISG